MATKKRTNDETKKTTSKSAAPRSKPAARPRAGAKPGARPGAKPAAKPGARPARPGAKATAGGPARPRLRASHASATGAAPRARKTGPGLARRRAPIAPPPEKGPRSPVSGRTPLAAPKRAVKRETPTPEASSHARELAISIATAGLDKKALGIEILDVTGKVDYADFLVVMTGRSDRHVHSIAVGIEEQLAHKNKVKALSVEGLSAATWVLLDFGDVVVHVFQEDSRRLYDIEGLWMDAGRVSLPEDQLKVAAQIDEADA